MLKLFEYTTANIRSGELNNGVQAHRSQYQLIRKLSKEGLKVITIKEYKP